MRKNDLNIAIGIAGLAAAILLFRRKGTDDGGGYGGAFPLPLRESVGAGIVPTVQTLSTAMGISVPGQTTNPFSEWGISFTESAQGTIAETQGSVDTFLGGVQTTKKSIVQIPGWMTGEDYIRNINKLKSEGYSYTGIDPYGAFTFSKTINGTKKEAAIQSGYGGVVSGGRVSVPGASSPVSNAPTPSSTFTSTGWVTNY